MVPALNRLSQTEPMIEGVAFFFKESELLAQRAEHGSFFKKVKRFSVLTCPQASSHTVISSIIQKSEMSFPTDTQTKRQGCADENICQ